MNMLARPDKTYGSIRLADGKWLIEGLPPHVSLRFKSMFARVSKTAAKTFMLADTPDTATDLLWFTHRFPLLMDVATRERLEAGHQRAVSQAAYAEHVLSVGWLPPTLARFRDGMAPYLFQSQAAALAAQLGRLLLLDDVGLGKTISALATILQSGHVPAAVVVQAHLADQWAEEYIAAFTTLTCHIIKGTKPYPLPPADIYIFRYSNIAGWVDVAATGVFKAVIFDEVQEMRHGPATQKGSAGRVFAEAACVRMGLTATPIYNYGSEIFNVVELIAPGALGTWHEFLLEWCSSHGNHWVVKDPPALGAYLRDASIALRRTEEDVDGQMPPVNVLLHHVPFDEQVVEHVAAEAKVLAQRVMTGSFTERGQAARELDMMARHSTGMAKATGVAALARFLVENGLKVLVAGWHRDVYDVWLKALADLRPMLYTGSESAAAKKRTKQAFVDGDCPLIFMSLRSGAGVDGLQQVCHTAVIGELDWSPQVHRQFIGRLRRPGQVHQVDAFYAHTNGGSDPVLVELLGLKSAQASGIVDPFRAQAQTVSDDSRIKKLAAAYLHEGATP
jgi:hypothetical protein